MLGDPVIPVGPGLISISMKMVKSLDGSRTHTKPCFTEMVIRWRGKFTLRNLRCKAGFPSETKQG